MTFTEIFEAIAEATGIEYSHFSVLGRIWDLADYYGVERRGKLVSQVLRELPQLVNRSPESNLIHDLLQMTVRYSKYLCLTGAYHQDTTTGKNLWDISKVTSKKNSNGASITNNGDGSLSVVIADTSDGVTSDEKISDICPQLQIGQTATLSLVSTGSIKYIYLFEKKETWISGNSKTIDQKILDSHIVYYASGLGTSATISDIQVEIGAEATEYEPYTGGVPSPNPDYAQEMQAVEIGDLYSVGKNLLNNKNFKNKSNGDTTGVATETGVTITGNYFVYYVIDNVPKNTDLYLSYTKSGAGRNLVSIYDNENFDNLITSKTDGSSISFNVGEHESIVIVFYCSSGTANTSTYSNIMLNVGDTAEPYTPYTGADTVTLDKPLILRALPNGVCDTYEDGVITRRVGVVELDGSEDERWGYQSDVNVFATQIGGVGVRNRGCLCDKIQYAPVGKNPQQLAYLCCGFNPKAKYSSTFYIKAVDEFNLSLDDFKTYLQSNPITVWYELATPTTEALDIDLEWYGMENFWTDSELDPNMTWKGVSTGVD